MINKVLLFLLILNFGSCLLIPGFMLADVKSDKDVKNIAILLNYCLDIQNSSEEDETETNKPVKEFDPFILQYHSNKFLLNDNNLKNAFSYNKLYNSTSLSPIALPPKLS